MLTNIQKWQKWFTESNATNTLPKFEDAQALLKGANKPKPAPSPVPAPGPVAKPTFLFSLPNNVWPGWMHSDKENADKLTGKDKDAAIANLNHANQIWNNEGREQSAPLACYPLLDDGTLDINNPILGTTSWPSQILTPVTGGSFDTSTNAGVLALCSSMRMPGPNPNAPPWPKPGQ